VHAAGCHPFRPSTAAIDSKNTNPNLHPPPAAPPCTAGANCEKRLTPSGVYTNYDPTPGGNSTGGQTQTTSYLMVRVGV